ncbi:drs2 neo1 protein [Basidiobolus ranarum]|uniref:Drs2 neo1 protein n=1 Tax=Basidiobolus ranarum TaxID=34480 RepID=A0ABR2WL12_9FUNG
MFEKDLNAETLLRFPSLYKTGQNNEMFNLKVFWIWMINGVIQSVWITYIPLITQGALSRGDVEDSPQLYFLGVIVYTAVVLVVTIKLSLLESHNWTWITAFATIGTIGLWFIWQLAFSLIYKPQDATNGYEVYGVFQAMVGHADFWGALVLVVVAALVPRVTLIVLKRSFWPTEVDKFQEWEKDEQKISRIQEKGDSTEGASKRQSLLKRLSPWSSKRSSRACKLPELGGRSGWMGRPARLSAHLETQEYENFALSESSIHKTNSN